MKRKLFGLAGLILAFSFFTACPGPKPTDKVEGNLEITAGKTYASKDAKEITINLATDTFKAAVADAAILSVKEDKEGDDAIDLSANFKLKTALENKASTATFYFSGSTNESFNNKDFIVTVKKTALNGTYAEDKAGLEVGKITITSKASASFTTGADNVISFVAGKADETGKKAVIKLVGAKLAKDADTAAADIDVSSWFGTTLPAGISATRSKITTDGGSDEITVTFKAANTVAYSGNAVEVKAKVAVSSDVEITTSNELVFFITKDPADTSDDATKKPSATVSNTNIKAAVGSALESEDITLTLDGDCLKMDVPAEDLKTGLEQAVMINDGSQEAKLLSSYGLSVAVESYNKGSKVVKFKLVSDKVTNAVSGTLVGAIPSVILCNNSAVQVTPNENAKVSISSVALNPSSVSISSADTGSVDVEFTLTNDTFKAFTAGQDVKAWFVGLPEGVSAKVASAVEANKASVSVTFSTTGTTAVAVNDYAFTIPADVLNSGIAISSKIQLEVKVAD